MITAHAWLASNGVFCPDCKGWAMDDTVPMDGEAMCDLKCNRETDMPTCDGCGELLVTKEMGDYYSHPAYSFEAPETPEYLAVLEARIDRAYKHGVNHGLRGIAFHLDLYLGNAEKRAAYERGYLKGESDRNKQIDVADRAIEDAEVA